MNLVLSRYRAWTCSLIILLQMVSCSNDRSPPQKSQQSQIQTAHAQDTTEVADETPIGGKSPVLTAYFGNLHIHTGWSYDTYLMGTPTTPNDAYRFARGETIRHASGTNIQIKGPPLDFLAVTDHSEYLGELFNAAKGEIALPIDKVALLRKIFSGTEQERNEAYLEIDLSLLDRPVEGLNDLKQINSAWMKMVAVADDHYVPGIFTTFAGFEWTSTAELLNLHRNVIFRSSKVPQLPFSSFDSMQPEDLWTWMDAQRNSGIELLAIPHNSNLSGGAMFPVTDSNGRDIDAAWAITRMRNEPLVEVSQAKGTSETHPLLSLNDEMADFEIIDKSWAEMYTPEAMQENTADPLAKFRGSYVRAAYKTGLLLETEKEFNPYKFGLIGSTDTHNGGGSFQEDHYMGAHGMDDADADIRLKSKPKAGMSSIERSASGLVGVWAEQNTRESIFDALARKEVYATSGTRIRVHFFAGYDYESKLANDLDAVNVASASGVSMGGDLNPDPDGKIPKFFAWASRDPQSAALDRVQIVKGWVVDGVASEQVFDVACSNQRTPDPVTYRCKDSMASADPATCEFRQFEGATGLSVVWQDPSFSSDEKAFYYVRVLENPTCRWSTWDALKTGSVLDPRVPATIQERAWSSPIWYSP